MSTRAFDVIVIGAGAAGEVLAGRVAEKGHQVAVIESELVGGECSFYACMPSKALLRPADALAEVRRVPGAAEGVTAELDVDAVLTRRDQIVHDMSDSDAVPWLEDRGVALIRGHARLEGERHVRVGELLCEAREAVVIAVGSAAAIPAIPGLAEAKPWTNREVTTAHRIPGSLVVLGGGLVGVEMAQAYSTLGCTVTLIEAAERLLAREEPFAAEQVLESLVERGVDVRVAVEARAVRRHGPSVTVDLSDGDCLEGEEILVALGRVTEMMRAARVCSKKRPATTAEAGWIASSAMRPIASESARRDRAPPARAPAVSPTDDVVCFWSGALASCDRNQAAMSPCTWATLTRRSVVSRPACGPQ